MAATLQSEGPDASRRALRRSDIYVGLISASRDLFTNNVQLKFAQTK